MKNDITRKHFLHLGVGATAAALLPACGGDDGTDTGAGTEDPSSSTNPTTTATTTTDSATTDPTDTDPSTSTDPATTDVPTTTDPATTDASTSTDPTDATTESGTTEVDTTGTTGDAFDCSVEPMIIIGGNHMHQMTVTPAEIAAGVEVVYDIMGTSAHTHTVTLTPADFATLAAEGVVSVDSTNNGHMHTITVTCV